MPIRIGSPLCAAAFETESKPASNAAALRRSAFPTFQFMAFLPWDGTSLRAAFVVQSPKS
jgi:hypothetical protein